MDCGKSINLFEMKKKSLPDCLMDIYFFTNSFKTFTNYYCAK